MRWSPRERSKEAEPEEADRERESKEDILRVAMATVQDYLFAAAASSSSTDDNIIKGAFVVFRQWPA